MVKNNVTLLKILNTLAKEAIKEKIVNYAIATASSNVMDSLTIKNYPMIMLVPGGQHVWREETTTFNIDIFYIDRLLDGSQDELTIQSVGMEELKHYIAKIRELEYVLDTDSNVYLQGFTTTEKDADRCSGALARLNITVANYSPCYVD